MANDLFARIGRLDAEHRRDREAILSKLNDLSSGARRTPPQTAQQESGYKEMNEKWAERILQGDVAGVLEEYTNLRRTAEETLSTRAREQMNGILGRMEEAPLFKEVKEQVTQIAGSLLGQGYSPQDAVAFAYEKARADHLYKMVGSGNVNHDVDGSALETSTGGSKREDAGSRKGKLNSEGKAAWEKNKAYFKDEGDFIASMAPRVRERFVG